MGRSGPGPRPTGAVAVPGIASARFRPQKRRDPGCLPRVGPCQKAIRASSVLPASGALQVPGRPHYLRPSDVTGTGYAAEVDVLANERFAAVGGALLAALSESGLCARRAANVMSWFVVAQLALGPWRARGEVRPAALAARMGVSRWTEWRARRDAVSAGVIRDWSLPDPEARGYGRGAVRVVELAFVRTRSVTQKVAAIKEERATRAERRRAERARAKAERQADQVVHAATPTSDGARADEVSTAPLGPGDLTGPAAGQLWSMLQRVQARAGRAGPAPPSSAG